MTKPGYRKAVLSIIFAGGMLNSQIHIASYAENKIESSGSLESVIQDIVDCSAITPDLRAFHLLMLAKDCTSHEDRSSIRAKYETYKSNYGGRWTTTSIPRDTLARLANKISKESHASDNFKQTSGQVKAISSTTKDDEDLRIADFATQQAILQLEKVCDRFAKLNMLFIASKLLHSAGNSKAENKCNSLIEATIQACERDPRINEDETVSAYSVLNSMAYGLLPVDLPERPPKKDKWGREMEVTPHTEQEFKVAEKLKLRALKLVDRLSADTHARRMAHRDMALWYFTLDKNDDSQREKQTLFKLIGAEGERLLYPQSQGCGRLVWWQVKVLMIQGACGMG